MRLPKLSVTSLDVLTAQIGRELAEGKWWQVVYDLETCGVSVRSKAMVSSMFGGSSSEMAGPEPQQKDRPYYQGWLDYVYFGGKRLICLAVQESLSQGEIKKVYDEGDALPNEWHPSDHLPVACCFSWRK